MPAAKRVQTARAPRPPELDEDAEPLDALEGSELEGARLVGADVSGRRFEDLRLTDCVLGGPNLANLRGRGATLRRVVIRNGRLTGLELNEAELTDVTFADCLIDLASFAGSDLTAVTFDGCILRQTDFLEAKLDSVRFHDCDMAEADLRRARLHRCELRRSRLIGAHGIESLRGVAMEWPDIVEHAGVFAAALGIRVLED
jgi:uncharacterized protein YjbI with pentapeptide repeats